MNGVQLDSTALALALPEPPPTPAENRFQPSFGDHLQQARRQEDRNLPRETTRDESPAERSAETQASPSKSETSNAEDSTLPEKSREGADKKQAPEAAEEKEPGTLSGEHPLVDAAVAIADVVVPTALPTSSAAGVVSDAAPVLEDAIAAQASGPELSGVQPASGHEDVPTHIAGPEFGESKLPVNRVAPVTKEKKKPAGAENEPNDKSQVALASEPADASDQVTLPDEHGDGAAKPATNETPVIERPAAASNQGLVPASPNVALSAADVSGPATAIGSEPADNRPTAALPAVPGSSELKDAAASPSEPATPPPASPVDGSLTKPPAFVLPGRNSHKPSGLPQLSDAERARLVQRVARALETAGEGGQMRLRLSPPELGALRMDVSVQHGVLTAHVEAETPQARMLLLDNLPALRERLQEQNVKIERFDVDLMNQPSGGQPQSYRQQREENSPDEAGRQTGKQSVNAKTASETPPAVARRVGGGEKLNVVI